MIMQIALASFVFSISLSKTFFYCLFACFFVNTTLDSDGFIHYSRIFSLQVTLFLILVWRYSSHDLVFVFFQLKLFFYFEFLLNLSH